MNEWRYTKSVIEWFKAIKNKTKISFMKLDIVEFNLSISKELMYIYIYIYILIYPKKPSNLFSL